MRYLTLEQAIHESRRTQDHHLTVGLATGCFDVFHIGHLRMLQAASEIVDWLLVGVNRDASVTAQKGPGRPRFPFPDRCAVLLSLRCVDAVVGFSEPTPVELIEAVQPTHFIKGTDYMGQELPEQKVLFRWGVKVLFLGDEKTRSSTELLDLL